MNYLLITLIWAGYCALHSYLISIKFTQWMMQSLKNYYAFYRLFYIIISVVLIIPAFHLTNQLASEVIINYNPPWSFIRYGLIIASLLLFFKAFFFDYDSLSFFGIRQILSFRTKLVNQNNEIKRNGLLGIVRHPMYLALIIYIWCQNFRLTDILVNSVLTIYIIIGTILEERKLVLEFGETYIQYQKEVPMIIPFTKVKPRN
jgi:methanethiol S-methyltransferase